MFDKLLMHQKQNRNSATHLNRATWIISPLRSKFKRLRSASSLEQMRNVADETKQWCDIQCEALEFR